MKRFVLWTAGIVCGLWVAGQLREAGGRVAKRSAGLDLNQCTREDLLALPGMTVAFTDRIIANRPYNDSYDLVKRRILSRDEYDRIAGKIEAR